jgi:hypothetical protein
MICPDDDPFGSKHVGKPVNILSSESTYTIFLTLPVSSATLFSDIDCEFMMLWTENGAEMKIVRHANKTICWRLCTLSKPVWQKHTYRQQYLGPFGTFGQLRPYHPEIWIKWLVLRILNCQCFLHTHTHTHTHTHKSAFLFAHLMSLAFYWRLQCTMKIKSNVYFV